MLNTKKKTWLALSGTLAVVVGFWFMFYAPGEREEENLRREIAEKRAFITGVSALPVTLRKTREKMRLTDTYLAQWRERTPKDREVSRVFAEINRIARLCAVETTRFDPLPTAPMQTISKVPVLVELSAPFDALSAMLGKLEMLETPIWIEGIQIKENGKSENSVKCEIKLVVFASNSQQSD